MIVDGKKGGGLRGPAHGPEGGIETLNVDTGDTLETEGGEIIINAVASEIHCEELSKINQSAGNGIAIPCGKDGPQKTTAAKGGKTTQKTFTATTAKNTAAADNSSGAPNWHLTLKEYWARTNPNMPATKRREKYQNEIVKPLLHDSAERNNYLLAITTGDLIYSQVVAILKSADAWDPANRFVAGIVASNDVHHYDAEILRLPIDLYLAKPYFKNNFTPQGAGKWYHHQLRTMLANSEILNHVAAGHVGRTNIKELLTGSGLWKTGDPRIKELQEIIQRDAGKILGGGGIIGIESAKQKLSNLAAIILECKRDSGHADAVRDEMENAFVERLMRDSRDGVTYNKTKLENVAREYGIESQTEAKELAELSIIRLARTAQISWLDYEKRYAAVVKVYEDQLNLSHRTSKSIELQQYSTPAPIGYVGGHYIGADTAEANFKTFFEPSAGNGLLTIAGNPEDFIVNEIDDFRRSNLKKQGFKEVWNVDASEPFKGYAKSFDGIITNPPFGSVDKVMYGTTPIKSLEQLMALRALDTMKDDGKAAIIIGGHTEFDGQGRIKAGKNRSFFVYLYKHYDVQDVINIDSSKMYSRQGTGFNVRLILIAGRKKTPGGFPPLVTGRPPMVEVESPVPVDNFDTLWKRVRASLNFGHAAASGLAKEITFTQ